MDKTKKDKVTVLKNNELEWMKKYKDTTINNIADDVHSYSIIKNSSLVQLKNKYSKKISKIKSSEKYSSPEKDLKIKEIKRNRDRKIGGYESKIRKQIERKTNRGRKRKEKVLNKMDMKINTIKNVNQNSFLRYKFYSMFRPSKYIPLLNGIYDWINKNKLLLVITIIAIMAGATTDTFFTKFNIMTNILKNNVEYGVLAIGMTFILLTGGIDLSVGSLLGLLGIFISKGIFNGQSLGVAILIAFIITIVVGLAHGLLVSKLKLPPFIVTLVGLLGYRGVARIMANSKTYTVSSDSMTKLNTGDFLGIPYLVWIFIGVAIIAMFILRFTKLGRNIYAVGGNEKAAKLSGVKTWLVITSVYVIIAITVVIATISYASRVGSFNPTTGTGYELDVIAAVVLGGTSLNGGKGGVGKTIIGWLVISTLSNAMVLLGYKEDWQLVFKGIIILAAVILDKDFDLINRFRKLIYKFA